MAKRTPNTLLRKKNFFLFLIKVLTKCMGRMVFVLFSIVLVYCLYSGGRKEPQTWVPTSPRVDEYENGLFADWRNFMITKTDKGVNFTYVDIFTNRQHMSARVAFLIPSLELGSFEYRKLVTRLYDSFGRIIVFDSVVFRSFDTETLGSVISGAFHFVTGNVKVFSLGYGPSSSLVAALVHNSSLRSHFDSFTTIYDDCQVHPGRRGETDGQDMSACQSAMSGKQVPDKHLETLRNTKTLLAGNNQFLARLNNSPWIFRGQHSIVCSSSMLASPPKEPSGLSIETNCKCSSRSSPWDCADQIAQAWKQLVVV